MIDKSIVNFEHLSILRQYFNGILFVGHMKYFLKKAQVFKEIKSDTFQHLSINVFKHKII